MSERKQFDSEIKSIDATQGLITRLVSVFGNVDAQNDRVVVGAFTKTIAKWQDRQARGQHLPVVFAHKDDPHMILGKVVGMRQTDEGLEVDEQYFLHKPAAKDAFEAQVEGVLPGSSFAYDARRARRGADGVRDLIEIDLVEVGPTIYPANDATRLVSVKDREGGQAESEQEAETAEESEGEALGLKHNALARHKASLRAIRDSADDLLRQLGDIADEVAEAEGESDGKTEDREVKVDDREDTLAAFRAMTAELSLDHETETVQ